MTLNVRSAAWGKISSVPKNKQNSNDIKNPALRRQDFFVFLFLICIRFCQPVELFGREDGVLSLKAESIELERCEPSSRIEGRMRYLSNCFHLNSI